MQPKLRGDLHVSVQVYGGQACYVIQDGLAGKFYRLGIAEYTFVSLLDGHRTIAEAMGMTAAVCGADGLDQRDVATLCKWLIECSLASTEPSSCPRRMNENRSKQHTRRMLGHVNPIIQKIPLMNPMPLLRPLDSIAKFLFGMPGLVLWLAVAITGIVSVVGSWNDLSTSGVQFIARDNWVWMLVTWLVLKLIHELGHALACRRFDGHVRECGIVLILFAPMPYVDVTSVWAIDSKWKRILISSAGMLFEIFCAAVAAIVWAGTLDPLLKQHAMNVMVTATVMTLVFNANPLMRFDGYYILTDWFETPNLATHSRQWLSYAARRHLMGLAIQRPNWPEGSRWGIIAYAIASLLWRLIVCFTLAISAEVLMHGAGQVLAAEAVVLWIAAPLYRSIRAVTQNPTANRRRLFTFAGLAAATVWLCWSVIPWYSRSTVPLVVDYYPSGEVRTAVDGLLQQNFVSVGDTVSSGQIHRCRQNRREDVTNTAHPIDASRRTAARSDHSRLDRRHCRGK